MPNDPTYPARECAQVQPSIGLSFLPLASIWPPFLLLISVRRVLLRRKGMFLLREEYISFVWLITTPRASTSLNRSYIFLETCFSWWDLGILTDGKRLTQGAGWTNSCSKISLSYYLPTGWAIWSNLSVVLTVVLVWARSVL